LNISLDLAFAQGQWVLGEHDNQWRVVNKDGERLWDLPSCLDERGVMSVIRMGREFELKAFNTGIQFGKEKANAIAKTMLSEKDLQIRSLEAMNEELSTHLDRLIGG
jgi:hypothetical protein